MTQEHPEQDGAEYHYRKFLEALGLDPESSEHLADTPRRVVEAYRDDLFKGLDEEPREELSRTFRDVGQQQGDAGFVIVDNIQVQSMCAHHLLPFRGVAHVGYIPQHEVVGLSKLARVVEGYSRRPQVQERLTNQVANAVHEELNALATIVVVLAEHECMTCRGVREPYSKTRTAAIRGKARDSASLKQEFYHLLDAQNHE